MVNINQNITKSTNYLFELTALPNTSYFCYAATIPGVSLGITNYNMPQLDQPLPSAKLSFVPLTINVKIDEDYANYKELFTWIRSLAPYDANTYALREALKDNILFKNFFCNATLIILNNDKMPITSILFRDVWPMAIGQIQLSSQDDKELECQIQFAYLDYTFVD